MVSHKPRASPISKLHDEILWSIFQFNSRPIDHSPEDSTEEISWFLFRLEEPQAGAPLMVNRRTSQVCRRWRKVIVNSPSIWANGIELQYLDQLGDEWRKEVLRQTGNAPLTVIGKVGIDCWRENHNRARAFFLNLLDVHWNRMRKLFISSYDTSLDERLCIASSHPAPNLEVLVISLHQSHAIGNHAIPFMNHAPRLRRLHTSRLSFNLPESSPSWSSNIRHLNIMWSQQDMSIAKLLLGLENMTFLQTLRLCDVTPPNSDMDSVRPNTRIPTITFSSLTHLTVQESDLAILDLMPCIIIPRGCTFEVETDLEDFYTEVPERVALCYATFFKNNFSPGDVTEVYYSLQYMNFKYPDEESNSDEADDMYQFHISVGGPTESRSRHPYFKYYASLMGVSWTPFRMAAALSSLDLSNVTTLKLRLTPHKDASVLEHPLFQSMYDFLLALKSVETLHTDDFTLEFYMRSEDLRAPNVLFPRLVNVFTDYWDIGITRFLDYRCKTSSEEVGRIKRVVFTEYSTVSCGDPSVVKGARKFGVAVGWQGKAIEKVSFADDGVLEFAP